MGFPGGLCNANFAAIWQPLIFGPFFWGGNMLGRVISAGCLVRRRRRGWRAGQVEVSARSCPGRLWSRSGGKSPVGELLPRLPPTQRHSGPPAAQCDRRTSCRADPGPLRRRSPCQTAGSRLKMSLQRAGGMNLGRLPSRISPAWLRTQMACFLSPRSRPTVMDGILAFIAAVSVSRRASAASYLLI